MRTDTSVHLQLRPVRFAFLIDHNDSRGLADAISANSLLWGGAMNPIIPFYKRAPRHLKGTGFSADAYSHGILSHFDPDVIVTSRSWSRSVEFGEHRQVVEIEKLLTQLQSKGSSEYGLGLFHILPHFIDKELKFVRRAPLMFNQPKPSRKHRLFYSALFGQPPSGTMADAWKSCGHVFGIKSVSCTANDYLRFLDPQNHFIRRLTTLYQGTMRRIQWEDSYCAFVLDPDSTQDIIDYINLRALGWHIIPVIGAAFNSDSENFHQLKNEINHIHKPMRFFKEMYRHVKLIRSHSINSNVFQSVVDCICGDPEIAPKVVIHDFVPRYYDSACIAYDKTERGEFYSQKKTLSITPEPMGGDELLRIAALFPKFVDQEDYQSWDGRVANEVAIRNYSRNQMTSEVIPPNLDGLGVWFAGPRSESRVADSGIVIMPNRHDRDASIQLPNATHVIRTRLALKDWQIEKGPHTDITIKAYEQLEGRWGVMRSIMKEGVVKLLSSLEKKKAIATDKAQIELTRHLGGQTFRNQASSILHDLLEKGVLRLGHHVTCTVCSYDNWVALAGLAEKIECERCLSTFTLPVASKDSVRLAYRSTGPFAMDNYAQGMYSSLLTYNFFNQNMDYPTTAMFNLLMENMKTDVKLEVDVALLVREGRFRDRGHSIVLTECKTGRPFEAKDVNRMKLLGNLYPDAILVFSSLKRKLEDSEKRRIRSLVDYFDRKRSVRTGFIMILTGNELYTHDRPPHCWEGTPLMAKYKGFYGFEEVARATREIYLA